MQKVKRLKRINIVGYEYKIKYLKTCTVNGVESNGATLFDKMVIYVATDGRNEADIYQVLMHEILHIVQRHLRIPVPRDEEIEEQVVDGFAVGIAQVFLNNKLIS